MERTILLSVDGVPIINLVVERGTKIREIKQLLQPYIKSPDTKIYFFVNSKNKMDVFDTDKYDSLNLESVWNILETPYIEINNKEQNINKQNKQINKQNINKKQKEQKQITFSGNKDVDYMILMNLSDKDLGNVCRTDRYTRSLCADDTFWMNRTFQRFNVSDNSNLDIKSLKEYKEQYHKSWREYYIELVDFLEQNYALRTTPYSWLENNDNFYFIKKERKDLLEIYNIMVNNSSGLNSLENIRKILREKYVNPNAFFDDDYTIWYQDEETDEEEIDEEEEPINANKEKKTREEFLESLKLLGADPRFRPEVVLSILVEFIDSYDMKRTRETFQELETLSPYFTYQQLLNVLFNKISKAKYVDRIKDVLAIAVRKGATKEDIMKLLTAIPYASSPVNTSKYFIDSLKDSQKKMLDEVNKFIRHNF